VTEIIVYFYILYVNYLFAISWGRMSIALAIFIFTTVFTAKNAVSCRRFHGKTYLGGRRTMT
jgi:hypothetical protein